jgi:DNA-binding beta-propeller fold protein YncE
VNSSGQVVETFADSSINGPWDMTALDRGTSAVLFVTNVLNNIGSVASPNGFVSRITLSIPAGSIPSISSEALIATGFNTRTDMAALVIGPTGVGLGADGTLYVADTLDNQIVPILNALTSPTIGMPFTTAGLNGPLGLVIAPNGNIVVVNSLDGNMVEVTPGGTQVAIKSVDVTGVGAGDLFGLAIRDDKGVYFVNDGNNTLDLLH